MRYLAYVTTTTGKVYKAYFQDTLSAIQWMHSNSTDGCAMGWAIVSDEN
ncbi:MAG: hypothetical protein ACRDBG_26675 [Waterburya sp.]